MAISASNLTSNKGTSNSTFTTASVAPTSDALVLVAFCYYTGGTLPSMTPTVSGGGMTSWDKIAHNPYDSTATDYSTIFLYRAQQASPGSGTISITFDQSVSACYWSVDQVTGVAVGNNGADAVVQYDATTVGSGVASLTANLAAFADATNNVAYGSFGVQANSSTLSPGSGFTTLGRTDGAASDYCNIITEWRTGDFDPSASWTGTYWKSGTVSLEVTGTVTPTTQVDPDADNAAGGWTTTPLWSKVNDDSDASYITATAS